MVQKRLGQKVRIFRMVGIGILSWLIGMEPGCRRNSPSGPPDNGNPGKQDYVWTIDTINYPGSLQTTMRDMWASAPNDVYIVGHNELGFGKMFHYDGKNWRPVHLVIGEGGLIPGPIDLSAVDGFASNDVYAVGQRIYENPSPPPNFLDSSLIIHYDGVNWREVQLSYRGRQLIDVRGISPSTAWSGGVNGITYNNSAGQWIAHQSDTSIWFSAFAAEGKDVYALGYFPVPGVTIRAFFLHWMDTTWAIVDSFSEFVGYQAHFGQRALVNIQGTLYSAYQGGFRKDGSSWTKIFDSFPESLIGMFGTRPEHIFAVGTTGSIYHWNGKELHKYDQFTNVDILFDDVWCTEDEVFVVGNDGSKTYVYHGK